MPPLKFQPSADSLAENAEAVPQPEEPDFYMDGPYVVFTAAFHLRRGYCCNSGCRHCPYGER